VPLFIFCHPAVEFVGDRILLGRDPHDRPIGRRELERMLLPRRVLPHQVGDRRRPAQQLGASDQGRLLPRPSGSGTTWIILRRAPAIKDTPGA